MSAIILTLAWFKIQWFGLSIPEPLMMFLIGVFLILLPFFASRLTSKVVKSAEALHENIHETLNGGKTEKAN